MFERFTDEARRTVLAARAHADRLGHRPVGTDHLLLGLLDTCPTVARALAGVDVDEVLLAHRDRPDDADRRALASLGIDLDQVRDATDRAFGPGALASSRLRHRRGRRPSPRGVFSLRAKKVLELSLREALRLKDRRIGPEHLALGLLREGHGPACLLLAEHGPDVATLRRDLEAAARTAATRRPA